MKLWETEKFTLNLKTGELMKSLSNMYIQAINFEQAHKNLLESEMDWLRLTGSWIIEKEGLQNNTPIVENEKDDVDWSPSGFRVSDSLRDSLLGINEEIEEENDDDKDNGDDEDKWFGKSYPAPDDDDDLPKYKEPKQFLGYSEKDWKDFLKNKTKFLESLDLDQILDWLTTLERPQVDDVWKTCVEYGLLERVKVVEGYLKYRYGKKN